MSRLTISQRKKALQRCYSEQQRIYEAAGKVWPGPVCAVQQARDLGDDEYLAQRNRNGELWATGDCSANMVLHHIDNNPENNPIDGSNHEPLCRCHNIKCDPPSDRTRRHKFLRDNESEQYTGRGGEGEGGRRSKGEIIFDNGGEPPIVRSMEQLKSIILKPKFEKVVRKVMKREKEAKWSDLIDAGVQDAKEKFDNGTELSITIKTAEDWLRPLCSALSRSAPFYMERVSGEKIVRWRTREKTKLEDDTGKEEAEAQAILTAPVDLREGSGK